MIQKMIVLILSTVLLMGCAMPIGNGGQERYQDTFMDVFDTITTVSGYAQSEEEFNSITSEIYQQLERYHQLFDIYHDYDGINNLKTINDQAGIAPVEVDTEIIELLLDCREYYEVSGGRVNVAMGSVLKLWHEARNAGIDDPENAKLPEADALKEAGQHCSFDTVVIDEENSTVYLEDEKQSLDVGAIAKGWATQKVCENAPSGLLVSVGGNVCVTGPKPEKNSSWVVGIQSPDGVAGKYLHTVELDYETCTCVVTSGDYQRYYTVDGKNYHHLIDPDTFYPAEYWKTVSIVCDDSGVADALSTALFLMTKEEGEKLLERYYACAVWTDLDGENYYSDGFKELINK